ncbi:S24 family peptidase [Microbulbifer sp. SAOS-129_SWC]|uniref:S24 family peptidase n=1 Tax=Microbulbifer sp. SAOS-129_SWC TaxID=3145235 RepID=UPI003217022B
MDIKDIRRANINLLADMYGRTDISEKLGYPDNNYINQLCSGHGSFGSRTARKIEEALQLPRGWMDYPQTNRAPGIGEKATEYNSGASQNPRITGRIPLLSWDTVGTYCGAMEKFEPKEALDWLICPVSHSNKAFALTVSGDSMVSPYPGHKSYPPGTIIYVDPEKKPTSDCRVVATVDGTATFKTLAKDLGQTFLRSINHNYPTADISNLDTCICGVVIGAFHPE